MEMKVCSQETPTEEEALKKRMATTRLTTLIILVIIQRKEIYACRPTQEYIILWNSKNAYIQIVVLYYAMSITTNTHSSLFHQFLPTFTHATQTFLCVCFQLNVALDLNWLLFLCLVRCCFKSFCQSGLQSIQTDTFPASRIVEIITLLIATNLRYLYVSLIEKQIHSYS